MITYSETTKFASEFKKLSKKFPSLKADLEVVKQYQIELFHSVEVSNAGIFKIEKVKNDEIYNSSKSKNSPADA